MATVKWNSQSEIEPTYISQIVSEAALDTPQKLFWRSNILNIENVETL
jgi:hypothetical protein